MSSNKDPSGINYGVMLAELRQVAKEEEEAFASTTAEYMRAKKEYKLTKFERDKKLQELEENAKEQLRKERKRRDDEARRKRVNARQVILEGGLKKRKTPAFPNEHERRALEKDIEDAMENVREREKEDPHRYNPFEDGYNYALGTRWEDDEETMCARCIEAGKICWRRILTPKGFDYSRFKSLRSCLRCIDISSYEGCNLGMACSSTGLLEKKRKRAVVMSDSEDENPINYRLRRRTTMTYYHADVSQRISENSTQVRNLDLDVEPNSDPYNDTPESDLEEGTSDVVSN